MLSRSSSFISFRFAHYPCNISFVCVCVVWCCESAAIEQQILTVSSKCSKHSQTLHSRIERERERTNHESNHVRAHFNVIIGLENKIGGNLFALAFRESERATHSTAIWRLHDSTSSAVVNAYTYNMHTHSHVNRISCMIREWAVCVSGTYMLTVCG